MVSSWPSGAYMVYLCSQITANYFPELSAPYYFLIAAIFVAAFIDCRR